MVVAGELTTERCDEILATLMPMWFGDRTLDFLRTTMGPELAARWMPQLDQFQLKSMDLSEFLRTCPWQLQPLVD